MSEPQEYELGEIAIIDPLQTGKGPQCRVIGKTKWIDGTTSYTVKTMDYAANGTVSHSVTAYELGKNF